MPNMTPEDYKREWGRLLTEWEHLALGAMVGGLFCLAGPLINFAMLPDGLEAPGDVVVVLPALLLVGFGYTAWRRKQRLDAAVASARTVLEAAIGEARAADHRKDV